MFTTLNKLMKTLDIGETSLVLIQKYLKILLRENENLNLISRKLDPDTIILEHIYDCLAPYKQFDGLAKIADLGSGGGFPGILLAIVYPKTTFSLHEKSPKKCSFLSLAVKELGLKNVNVVNQLISECSIDADAVTCRGFKSIKEIIDLTPDFYNSGKPYILYKGRLEKINEELDEAKLIYKLDAEMSRTAQLIEDKERYLIIVKKS